MSADIGKGDVVAATSYHPAQGGLQPYPVWKGDRASVIAVERDDVVCTACGDRGRGFLLNRFPLPAGVSWCPCGWRKIGGSEADTVALFAPLLNPAPRPRERVEATGDLMAAAVDIFRRAVAAFGRR